MAARVGWHLTALQRRQQAIALALAAAVLAATVGLPLLELVRQIGGVGWSGLGLLAVAAPWLLLLRSVAIAAGVTCVALVVGVPLGAAMARLRLPWGRALFAAHCLPMFLPPLIVALGWFHLLGREGLVGGDAASLALFSHAGVIAVLGSAFTPIVSSLTAVGVLSVDPSLEDAARPVAGPARVLASIVVPAAAPAIWLAAIVVFALSVSELGVPGFLRVPIYTTAVFARLAGADYAPGEAAALAAPMLFIGLSLLLAERRLVGRGAFAVLGLRGAGREPLRVGRRLRIAATVALSLVALLAVLPVAALGWVALRGRGFANLTQWGATAAWNSIAVSCGAAICILPVAVVAGHALARAQRAGMALDLLAMLGFFLPSAVLGAGIIGAYARPVLREVYATAAVISIGFVARYAAVGMRAFAVSVAQSAPSYEESATVAGASYLRRLTRIVIPMHRRGLGVAVLLGLLFALRDLDTAVLFYPPGGEPLTVRIFTLEANGPMPLVAALCLLQVALTTMVLAAGAWLLSGLRTERRS